MSGSRRRPPPLFAEFSKARQVLTLTLAPVLFGVLAAFALKWAEAAWWSWQATGVLLALVAGFEHLGLGSAALRGVAGGLLAAATITVARELIPGGDEAAFDPVTFTATAAVTSAVLHAGGAVLRRHSAPASRL